MLNSRHKCKYSLRILLLIPLWLAWPWSAQASEFAVASSQVSLVGSVEQDSVREGEVLVDIARRHGLGYREMRLANAGIDPWAPPPGAGATLPKQHILPSAERAGIVINLAERRLYFYEPGGHRVATYPVGIGRRDWPTPQGVTSVVDKLESPTWYPPMAVRIEHAARGDALPSRVPPGPDNPLGEYALVLGMPGYLIHGTNKPGGIGLRVSHGCIRLYPEDIADLFQRVRRGTPVRIVDQPVKAAVHRGRLYLEINPSDGIAAPDKALPGLIRDALRGQPPALGQSIAWPQVNAALRRADGIPVAVTPPVDS